MRSGRAEGADSAFEDGARPACEIFLPWPGFNSRPGQTPGILPGADLDERAASFAEQLHPGWRYLKPGPRKLHTRNVFQVLGRDLESPSSFLLCWTADGAESEDEASKSTGGTRTAIVLASRQSIPVINFARPRARERLDDLLTRLQQTRAIEPAQDRPRP
jgi:hypothetical protein